MGSFWEGVDFAQQDRGISEVIASAILTIPKDPFYQKVNLGFLSKERAPLIVTVFHDGFTF